MRYFKSLGSDGWKSAVLKIKMRKKLPAITITLTAVSIFCFLVLAEAFFMMTSGSFNALAAQRTASQAEQNARIEVKRLENLDYAELSYLAEHPRQVMDGVEDGNWESEVTLGPEKDLNGDDNVKIRLAHVSIFRTGDSVTRYDVDVPLTSATGTTPIGSVMTWTSEGKPTTGGVWLECNGQTIPSKYKHLRELIGDKTPDYRGLFLRGYGSQSIVVNDGYVKPNSTHTYSSGNLGQAAGDSFRNVYGFLPQMISAEQMWYYPMPGYGSYGYDNSVFEFADLKDPRSLAYDKFHWWFGSPGPVALSLPMITDSEGFKGISTHHHDNYTNFTPHLTAENRNNVDNDNGWNNALTKYRYTLSGNAENGYTLHEEEIHPPLSFYATSQDILLDFAKIMPTGDEIRPANVAVRYFIKAR